MRRIDSGAVNEYFLERARQPSRIARKLYRSSVGQSFALTAYGRLDQAPKEHACPTNDNKGHTNYRKEKLASLCADEDPTNNRQTKNSKYQPHEPQIEAHVAIENVAELVGNDSLKFVTRKYFHTAARHADGRIARGMARRKCVDSRLAVHEVNLRDRHT